jgi:hypothetical protein
VTPLLVLLLLLLLPGSINAQVVINEVHPVEEWVELYNLYSHEISLAGCTLHLQEDYTKYQKITFTENDKVEEYLLIEKSKPQWNWTSNWLNDSGDEVALNCDTLDNDSVRYGDKSGAVVSKPGTKSFGRSPDGIGGFFILETSTPGKMNSLPPTETPTIPPTPSLTPKPTATPKSTATTKPTPTVKQTALSPTPKPTPTQVEESTDELPMDEEDEAIDQPPLVMGVKDSEEPKITPDLQEEIKSTRKFPVFAGYFIGGGIMLLGAAGFPYIKKLRRGYTDTNDKNDDFWE